MELRSCRNLHFIAAIRGGFIAKFCNVDSQGNPALVVKTLRDIYEAEDAKKAALHSTVTLQDRHAFDLKRVKVEGSCLPFADRTVREIDHTTDEYGHGDHDEMSSDFSDSTSDKITLRQLKKMCKAKKRKLSSAMGSESKQIYDKVQSEEDEFDLKETLSSWKLKLLKKKSKKKRKCTTGSVTRSEVALSIKSEPVLDSEYSMQADSVLMPLIHVKSEDPESEFLRGPSPIAFIDDSSINYANGETLGTVISDRDRERDFEYENRQLVLFREEDQNCTLDNVCCDTFREDVEIDEHNNREQILFAEECQNCTVNEVSFDHLETPEPITLLLANSEETEHVSNQKYSCERFLNLPISEPKMEEDSNDQLSGVSSPEITLCVKDRSPDVCSCSNNSSLVLEISGQSSCSSGIGDLDRAVNTKNRTGENMRFAQQFSSLRCTDDDFVNIKDYVANEERSLTCSSADATEDCMNPGHHYVSIEDNSPTLVKKQPLVSTNADAERRSSPNSRTSAGAGVRSTSVPLQNPGRLPPTRKAISPTSQERLRLAVNSEELYDNTDHYKCKEKLDFGKQTESRPSRTGSSFGAAREVENSVQSGKLNQPKVIISPSQILKKSKNEKRGSPPKGNLEGPCFSRSLPCVSTGCTSIKSCSESAIAFTQRQMHDIESLAGRLVNELKSMKDIVEEKLLFESYRSLSLKIDADEVKTAIKNATKAEETARKWLSMMARDCNRFCKIMRLNQNSPAAPKTEVRTEKKKITFADEAGGMLCHVKFFENGMTAPESCSGKEDDLIL